MGSPALQHGFSFRAGIIRGLRSVAQGFSTHFSQDIQETHAWLSSSICQVVFVLFFLPHQMRLHVDPPSAPHSRSIYTSPALLSNRALFPTSTCSGSATLFCFSCQVSLNDLSDSFSTFVVVWFCRFSVRCKRCASWAASSVSVSFNVRRQDVESSGFNLWRSFNHNPWQWGSRSFFVSCDFLRQLQFWSHHLPRRSTQAVPVRRVPCITRCLSRPTFASPSSSSSSSQFSRFSIFTAAHFVYDFSCKTVKPAEQRTVIGYAHTCVLFRKCSAVSFHFSYSHFHKTVRHGTTSNPAHARITAS